MTKATGAGPLLRRWRKARRLSQLELALEAEVSARHLSFVETGRATPSREMLLTLATVLDVPLRERNVLLLAAGYAPVYGETSLNDSRMSQVRAVIEIMLGSNEPRAAVAHDRYWNVLMANAGFVRLLTIVLGKAPAGLSAMRVATSPQVNLLHLLFDPNGLRRVIVNWEASAKALLNQAYRRLAWARDEKLKALIEDVLKYPEVPERWREAELDAPQALILPIELDFNGKVARMFSTVTSVATPHDVTLQDLHIEIFYPADTESEAILHDFEQQIKALFREAESTRVTS
jgi:transcriptional regulator with XRE-family HTH domain